jgi:hypothetical protein
VIAEVFLARLERSLIRRGLLVDRYNDDFRFACNGWSEVVRALEVLEEEARLVGLTINDLKTVTWGRAKYEKHLDAAEALRQEIALEAELDLTRFNADEYDGTFAIELPDAEDVEVLSAVRVLDRWAEVAGRGRVSQRRRAEHRAVIELLPYAFSTLRGQRETPAEALKHCTGMLRFERTMTPAVAGYLLSREDDNAVLRSIDGLLRRGSYLNGWQTWWLQQPVARLPRFLDGAGAHRRLRWAQNALTSAEHSPVLRAEAARTLARHRRIDVRELLGIYDRSNHIVRPVLAASIALLHPSRDIRRSIVDESPINRWAYEWSERSL